MSIGKQIRNSYYVYILIDPRNNQPFYVGKGFHGRAYAHVTEATKHPKNKWSNPHKCRKILSILKDGKKIKYEFIFCKSSQAAFKKEQRLIAKYGRHNEGGLLTNLSVGGDQGHPIKKRVDQYDMQGNFIMRHESMADAARALDLSSRDIIARCCKRKDIRAAKGYIFCFEGDKPTPWKHKQAKIVVKKTLDGKTVARYTNTSDAAKSIGLKPSAVRLCCQGRSKTAGGFCFEYEDTKQ